jgi:hypothetical protein
MIARRAFASLRKTPYLDPTESTSTTFNLFTYAVHTRCGSPQKTRILVCSPFVGCMTNSYNIVLVTGGHHIHERSIKYDDSPWTY